MVELSVVIPSRDAGARLATCLDALAAQLDAEGRFEVIVVDDGSQPPIDPRLTERGDPFPLRIVRRASSGGIAVARNEGWRVARGRITLFFDDDIRADPRLVAGHLDTHSARTTRIGIGRLETRVGDDADWLARQFAGAWNAHIGALDAGRPPKVGDCYGGDLSVPTDLLRSVDGFDESFPRSEDVELAARLVEGGASLVYVPGDSLHEERKTGHAMLADARRNGAIAPRLVSVHPWLLAETELGSFVAFGQRQLLARRLATAARIRPEWLARGASILGRGRVGRSALTLLVHLAFWAGVRSSTDRATFERLTGGTAILMYHGFAAAGAHGSRYVVPADRFESQLQGLIRAGHQPIALDELLKDRAQGRLTTARSFVVTIDDAYAEIESIAAPILRRLGVPATIFVPEAWIGESNGWDRTGALAGRALLSEASLRTLAADGFELAPHSGTHPDLTAVSGDTLQDEVVGATGRLAERVGPLLPAFAYPYGRANEAAHGAVRAAAWTGLGVREGLAGPSSSAAELPRIEVRGMDSARRVRLAAWIGGTRRLVHR